MLKKDSAVCIRTVDYSETSQILTLFTRQTGKLSAIAKGSKRAKSSFDGPIELFAHGQIVYAGSGEHKLATLTEFQQNLPFSFLTRNLFALHCASLASELIDSTTDDCDPHPELYDAFIDYLQNTDHTENNTADILALLIFFQLNLLKEIGLMPILDHCVNCRTQYTTRNAHNEFYFSSSANGLICRDCEPAFPDKIPITKSAAAALYNLKTIAEAKDKTLKEIEKILLSHFTNTLGKQPKMAKYVLKN